MFLFGLVEADAFLSDCWVDSDDAVQLLESHTTLETNSNSLCDFTSVWRAKVEANDSVLISLVNQNFDVADFVFGFFFAFMVLPFQRLELRVIGGNIFSAKFLFCINFGEADCAILNGREYSRWDKIIVH